MGGFSDIGNRYMAANTDATIFSALGQHLADMSGVLPIAGPNVTFPQQGSTKPGKFIELLFLPNQPVPLPLGDDAEPKQGIMQASVMWPKGIGLAAALEVAGAIADHFKNETIFATGVQVKINREPWVSTPFQDEDRMKVPVSIPYIAFEQEN